FTAHSNLTSQIDSDVTKPCVNSCINAANRQEPSVKDVSPVAVWDAMITRIDEINHPLACKLREGEAVFASHEAKIIFTGGCAVHAESVGENIPLIRKLLEEISGISMSVSIETAATASLSKKELKEMVLQNPVVRDALDLFEGRIVDVLPIKEETAGS